MEIASLQYITRFRSTEEILIESSRALEGGCRWIQLRMKGATHDHIVSAASKLRILCDKYDARLIINDNADIAREVGADGVHVGRKDSPVWVARKILGPKAIIGATANNFEDIERAVKAGANYIGLGPYRFTETKKELSEILGLEGYTRIVEQCRAAGITVQIVAIGGIEVADVESVMSTGVSGVAISGAMGDAEDPVAATKQFLEALNIRS